MKRRDFLNLSGAVLSAPWVSVHSASRPGMIALTEPGVPQSYRFAAACINAQSIPSPLAQPRAALAAIIRELEQGNAVGGCTREATAFVVEQLLRGSVYAAARAAEHRYRANGLQHRGDGLDQASAAAALHHPHWPQYLPAALLQQGTRRGGFELITPYAREARSPAHLVTWYVRPV